MEIFILKQKITSLLDLFGEVVENMQKNVFRKTLVFGIILLFVGIEIIPIMNAANNQMITKSDSYIKLKDNLEKNTNISSLHKSSNTLETNLSIIISSGKGIGFFFPPILGREKFFCIAALIIYTRPLSGTTINNNYHSGLHVLIFIGIARVWYTKNILADDISLIGIGFAKAFP